MEYVMRKLIVLLALLTLMPMTAWSEFKEGENYVRYPRAFPVATGEKIEVREIFWYGCPHCYNLEPDLQRWEKNSMHAPSTHSRQWASSTKCTMH